MKKIACITIDIESDLQDPDGRIRMFESREYLDSYISVIEQYDVKVTGYVVTSLLDRYWDVFSFLKEHPNFELEVHSHNHIQSQACSYEEITIATETYFNAFGSMPRGYRAPNGLIDQKGIRYLIDHGYVYDASIFPSLRFDKYGYSNLHLPTKPFCIDTEQGSILEIPFAALAGIRLVASLSYNKLLGWSLFNNIERVFPLPSLMVYDSHFYDFYIPEISENLQGWKKFAHLRNGKKAFHIFEKMLTKLQHMNYKFDFVSSVHDDWRNNPDTLPVLSIDQMPSGDLAFK